MQQERQANKGPLLSYLVPLESVDLTYCLNMFISEALIGAGRLLFLTFGPSQAGFFKSTFPGCSLIFIRQTGVSLLAVINMLYEAVEAVLSTFPKLHLRHDTPHTKTKSLQAIS